MYEFMPSCEKLDLLRQSPSELWNGHGQHQLANASDKLLAKRWLFNISDWSEKNTFSKLIYQKQSTFSDKLFKKIKLKNKV
jgi:hypothetical protein